MTRIAVTSPSFSRHPLLRAELMTRFPGARLREDEGPLSGERLRDHLAGCNGAVIGLEPVDAALLDALPELRIVAKYGVGLDNIDQAACAARGVAIGWTPGVNSRSVAELALCFMLGLVRNVFFTGTRLRAGEWIKRGGSQLSGKTVGIIGVGHAGQALIRLLAPFGCRILANDIDDRTAFCAETGAIVCDKARIWAEADIVSLHVPLTPDTHHLIDAPALACLRPGAFVINTARGSIVDELALKAALDSGHLGGAALDVFAEEPPTDRALIEHSRLAATPHIGGNAEEAVLAMGRSAIGHLEHFFAGGRAA